MTARDKISQALVDTDNPRSASAKARSRRWTEFLDRFPALDSMTVLDLGGTAAFWRMAGTRPEHVTVVNLGERGEEPWLTHVLGDACNYQPTGSFDLVVSNSLLEHVGGPYRRQQLADIIRGAAPMHWVQTPYRYFPIEPHWMFPGFQWLPLAARVEISRRWPYGHHTTDEQKAKAYELSVGTDLVDQTEMRALFPDSELWRERFGGLVKSLVAIRG